MRGRYIDFLCTCCHHPCTAYPLSMSPTSSTFVTTDETTLTHHNHPKYTVNIMYNLGVAHSICLDTCIMTYIHHYAIEKIFTTLKIICSPPVHPSLFLNFWQPWIFLTPYIVLLFPECRIVGIIQYIPFSDLFISFSNTG